MTALLLDISFKAGLILAAAWVMSVAFRHASAAVRHVVWAAAAGGVLLLPALAVLLPAWSVPVPVYEWSSLAFRTQAHAGSSGAQVPALRLDPAAAPLLQPGSRTFGRTMSLADWAVALWTLGGIIGLLRLAAGYVIVRRLAADADRNPSISALAEELVQECRFSRRAQVMVARSSTMPIAFGVRRPVILLPSGAVEWPAERLRMVLLHELVHVQRCDCLTQLWMRLAWSLYWFHPLAWLAARQSLRERELACDDLVLALGARPSSYAQHLLEVARTLAPVKGTAWPAVAMARRSQLEARLRSILDADIRRETVGRFGVSVAGILAVACVLPLAAMRPTQADATAKIETSVSEAQVRAYVQSADYRQLEKIADELNRQQQFAEAEKLYLQALAMRGAKFGKESPQYADGLVILAKFYPSVSPRTAGRSGNPKTYWQGALTIREKTLGPEAPELVEPLYHLALLAHRDYGEAKPLYARALAISAKTQGPGNENLAPVLTNLGLLEEQHGDIPEAERLYSSAQSAAGSDTPQYATALELHARLLRQKGQDAEAHLAEMQASQIRVRHFSPPARQPAEKVYRVAGGISPPKLIRKVEPEYTEEARLAKYQGTAVLSIQIGLDGKAHYLGLVRSLGLGLDEKAAEAIRQWTFQPGTRDGRPVVVAATVEVNFRLL